jgi:hypothetical protein
VRIIRKVALLWAVRSVALRARRLDMIWVVVRVQLLVVR